MRIEIALVRVSINSMGIKGVTGTLTLRYLGGEMGEAIKGWRRLVLSGTGVSLDRP